VDTAAFLDRLGPTLTPEQVGKTILDLIIDPSHDQDAYLLTPTGLDQSGDGRQITGSCRCGPYFCRYCRGPNPVAWVNARRNAVGSP
jgi:hypothetical protein